MTEHKLFKPSRDEWLRWSQVVMDRLTTVVHVYSKPPFDDVFMPEKERQEKNATVLDLLRRIYNLTDEADTPSDSLAGVDHHDEQVLAGLTVMFSEALERLPTVAKDMQLLLKSPWTEKCNGRVASELFRGPMQNELEGIGSGHADNGRLPGVLQSLIERERDGEVRQPRKALHRTDNASHVTDESPHRSDTEVRRRWADKNSKHLRSAGRVD